MSVAVDLRRVMIASPNDVSLERHIIREAIHEWNAVNAASRRLVLLPVGWETNAAPDAGARPQQIISGQILLDSDLLIAVFWKRIGTPTGKAISGTVEEIDEHVAAGKPAMLYFSEIDPPATYRVNKTQAAAVRRFRRQAQKWSFCESYSSIEEFRRKLNRQLSHAVIAHFIRDSTFALDVPKDASRPRHSLDATVLLWRAAAADGVILRRIRADGVEILVDGVNIADDPDPVRWDLALGKLFREGCIKRTAPKSRRFEVTPYGYEVADLVRSLG